MWPISVSALLNGLQDTLLTKANCERKSVILLIINRFSLSTVKTVTAVGD